MTVTRSTRVGVVACGALAVHVRAIAKRRGWALDVHPLDATLHNRPERIAPAVSELLATLRAFLIHDGSTTETAVAMKLHRHTVGYRLSRVHEVSGLSPYESDGRERLSLGIKAQQLLDSERRLQDASLSR